MGSMSRRLEHRSEGSATSKIAMHAESIPSEEVDEEFSYVGLRNSPVQGESTTTPGPCPPREEGIPSAEAMGVEVSTRAEEPGSVLSSGANPPTPMPSNLEALVGADRPHPSVDLWNVMDPINMGQLIPDTARMECCGMHRFGSRHTR